MNELTVVEQSRLAEYEDVIEKGLETFVEVGNALAGIRDGGLYRNAYGTFEDYCKDRWGFSSEYARLHMRGSEVIHNLQQTPTIVGVLPQSESQTRPLTKLNPSDQVTAWNDAVTLADERDEKITARHVEEVVNYKLAASNHTTIDTEGYDGDEWYTPIEQIEAARGLMGSIDLDPATCEKAQEIIQAKNYYTKLDNGLNQKWEGNIWLNPPYSQPLINHFVNKLIDDYQGGLICQAVVLVNNSSDTKWFQSLLCKYIACFTKGRIPFWRPDQTSFSTRQGQVFFYLGNNEIYFQDIFSQFGTIVKAIK